MNYRFLAVKRIHSQPPSPQPLQLQVLAVLLTPHPARSNHVHQVIHHNW